MVGSVGSVLVGVDRADQVALRVEVEEICR
jgi:hypothetical protein